MTLPPKWKVKREVRRIREQIKHFTSRLTDPHFTRVHDRSFARRVRKLPGELPLGPRVAVFVLYQPKGVARSIFFTLRHLAQNGFSPIVVCNSPLSAEELAALRSLSALIVRRPNVGYDFGGYRDGIRIVRESGAKPERLIVMNDSTWFPLSEGDTTLQRLETLDTGMRGHIFKHEPKIGKGRDHVESHLLMFTADGIAHPSFARFWGGYPISNSRDLTIQRGEKGISDVFKRNGLGRDGLLSREKLRERLDRLDPDAMLDVLNRLVIHQEDVSSEQARLISAYDASERWRNETLDWMIGLLNSFKYLISATFIEPAVRYGGLGFAKKSNERRFHLARKRLLEAETVGRIPPLQLDVRREIEAAVESWQPDDDWRRAPGTAFIEE